jgi:hypothetical protein
VIIDDQHRRAHETIVARRPRKSIVASHTQLSEKPRRPTSPEFSKLGTRVLTRKIARMTPPACRAARY